MPKILLLIPVFFIAALGIFLTQNKNYPNYIQPLENKFPALIPGKNKFPTTSTTIILTGDIMLGRSVMTTSLSKDNPNYPFEKVADTLKNADLVFGNLENPIIENCPNSDSGLKFCADPKMIQGLLFAGVDILNLANNHIRNYGTEGLNQTKKYLRDAGIDFVGDNNLVVREIDGIKFGFLGFDFLTSDPKTSDFDLVRESKKKVDVLIVMTHWGVEYRSTPTDLQRLSAERIISSGADIIAGTHPHWVQSLENIDGKIVFYSLGNFIFDQPWSEETKKGMAVRLTYGRGGKIFNIEELPVYMRSIAQPEWVK